MGLFSKGKISDKRMPVMAGNWKMNKTTVEAVSLSQHIMFEYDRAWDVAEVVLCPPFTDLKSVSNVLAFENSSVKIAAQDVFWEDEGAYTGAICASMLKELGCEYCIIGHSERRGYFGETDEMINKKAKALIDREIYPILCCGESLAVREAGNTLAFVEDQVRAGLQNISPEAISKCIIAYEPIWAIGTGRAATPEQAQEVCKHIRGVVADIAGDQAAYHVRVLYGGSMKPANAELFLPCEDIDGGLIGGAALDAKSFAELVEAMLKIKL